MKLAHLNLMAFGPFTDQLVPLAETGHSLHLIYGPNEAGKSTTLRAISALLFGFDTKKGANAEDNQRHELSQLRLGGTLVKDSGESLSLVRRRGYKNTLQDPSGSLLDETELKPFLAGLDREIFAYRYGLNHERLLQGGQELLNSQGDFDNASILAAAFTGLRQLQLGLEEEAGKLYKPGGRATTGSPLLNRLPSELKETQKAQQQAALKGESFQGLERELLSAQGQQKQLEQALRDCDAQRQRLLRVQQAIPLLNRRTSLLTQLERLAGVKTLTLDFSARREKVLTQQEALLKQQAELQVDRAGLQSAVSSLVVDETLLAADPVLLALHADLGRIRKNETDLNDRGKLLSSEEHAAREILRSLSVPFDSSRSGYLEEAAEKLTPSMPRRNRLERLIADHSAHRSAVRTAEQRLQEARQDLERRRTGLAGLSAPLELEGLQRCVTLARQAGRIEEAYRQACSDHETLLARITRETQQLPYWQGGLPALAEVALPLDETLSTFDGQFKDLLAEQRAQQERVTSLQSELRQGAEQIRTLQLEGTVPTEAALQMLRSRRDAAWERIHGAFIHQAMSGEEVQMLLDISFSPPRPLLRAFPELMGEADAYSDRLRREAQRVAALAGLLSSQETRQEELNRRQSTLQALELRLSELHQAWRVLWPMLKRPQAQPFPSVSELRGFVDRARKLQTAAEEARAHESRAEFLNTQVQYLIRIVEEAFHALGRTIHPASLDSLEARLVFAEQFIRKQEEQGRQRRSLMDAILELEGREQREAAALESARVQLREWQEGWREAILPLGLPESTSPDEAQSQLRQVDVLNGHLRQIKDLRARIHGMERDNQAFVARVQTLVAGLASAPTDLQPTVLVSRLKEQLDAERQRLQRRQSLQEQLREVDNRLQKVALEVDRVQTRVQALLLEADTDRLEALPELEERSREKLEMEQSIRDLDSRLLDTAGGSPLEAWFREIQQAPIDSVRLELEALGTQRLRLEGELKDVSEKVGQLRSELGQHDGSDRAGQLAEDGQQLLAEMREGLEQYVRLRLSVLLLKHTTQIWRQKHQGALLSRTSALFSRLTLGAFSGLDADFNEKDERILLGMRAGRDEQVRVEQMSQGTRDQLYLALRLAWLELQLRQQERIPFVVDDLLINFDDRRSAATLEVLAEFSKVTQVIFFTHHEHLLDLAGRVLKPEQYQTIRLGAGA